MSILSSSRKVEISIKTIWVRKKKKKTNGNNHFDVISALQMSHSTLSFEWWNHCIIKSEFIVFRWFFFFIVFVSLVLRVYILWVLIIPCLLKIFSISNQFFTETVNNKKNERENHFVFVLWKGTATLKLLVYDKMGNKKYSFIWKLSQARQHFSTWLVQFFTPSYERLYVRK